MSHHSIGDQEDGNAFSETEFALKSKSQNLMEIGKEKDEMHDRFWEISKYTDEDFDPHVSRLKVPKLVSFQKRSSLKSESFLAKLKIQNISNLPMTYNVRNSTAGKFEIKQRVDWIPPHSDASVEIRIRKGLDQDHSKVRDIVKECFMIFATPIFRDKHTTQKGKLELFWRAFGSHLLPYYHAEHHIVTINTLPDEGFVPGNFLNTSNFSLLDFHALSFIALDKKVLKNWKAISDEKFHSLWTAGEDEKENKSVKEFRLRELKHVIRRCELDVKTQRKWKQIKILSGLLAICIATLAMSLRNFNLK